MSRKFKTILTVFGLCAVSVFAITASGCNDLKETINQLKCDHVLIDGEVTKEATCKEEGKSTKECTLCTYTETVTIEKLNHTAIDLLAVEPTCTKSGITAGKKCGVCDEILVAQEIIAPLGHEVSVLEAVAPTCSEVGKTEGSECKKCNTVFVKQKDIPMLEHVLQEMEAYEATCEEKGFTGGVKCKNCDYVATGELIPALGHTYDDGVVTKEASCGVIGEKTYTCETCEGTKIEEIPSLTHEYEVVITTEPTCTENGFNTHTCKNCGISWTSDILANGHSYEGNVCTVCGEGLISFTIDGTSYTAEANMTWWSWVTSEYNTDGFANASGNLVASDGCRVQYGTTYVTATTYPELVDGGIYMIKHKCSAAQFTFTIDGTTYYAEEGMTWGEWVESDYNTMGCTLDDDCLAEFADEDESHTCNEGCYYYVEGDNGLVLLTDRGDTLVKSNDVITGDKNYYRGVGSN